MKKILCVTSMLLLISGLTCSSASPRGSSRNLTTMDAPIANVVDEDRKPQMAQPARLSEEAIKAIANKHFKRAADAYCDIEMRGDYCFVSPPVKNRSALEEKGIYIHSTSGQIASLVSRAEAERIARRHFKLTSESPVMIEAQHNWYF